MDGSMAARSDINERRGGISFELSKQAELIDRLEEVIGQLSNQLETAMKSEQESPGIKMGGDVDVVSISPIVSHIQANTRRIAQQFDRLMKLQDRLEL